jgi:hypothetical protein
MAARVQPGRVRAAQPSLHHFVAKADWSDDAVLAAVRARVLPVIEQRGPLQALIVDDTGIPKPELRIGLELLVCLRNGRFAGPEGIGNEAGEDVDHGVHGRSMT